MTAHAMTGAEQMALHGAAHDLHRQFRGIFSHETVTELLLSSYQDLAVTATIPDWLVLGAERFARQRLEALAHAGARASDAVPAVLFLCMRNAGRSQIALGWLIHLAAGRAIAWSAGSSPMARVDPLVRVVMAEVGIDIGDEFPKPWEAELELAADAVVTMGCGDACPLLPGKHYEDWEIGDPGGRTIDQVRLIRDDIRGRVSGLLSRLDVLV